ncbi:MAG: M20 family metallopeptidase [Caldiserica bacterium]|nr:M20 family metallopeptidase [Caldisericota bacterium]MDH7562583.1 M20 family metallopeptidase [Caldisericota bacterium]
MSLERALSLLFDLISLDTSNPPGSEGEICQYLGNLFSREGLSWDLISFHPRRPSFYSFLEGRFPGSIVLTGHLDTVSPLGSWSFDPFKPFQKEGKIFGLGACDMKSGVALVLDLFLKFSRKGKPQHSLKIALTSDEEDQYRGAQSFREAGVLDDALFVLELEPTDSLPLIGEKGEFWVRAHFRGREAHGSTPEKGINSVLAQAKFLLELEREVSLLPPRDFWGRTTLNMGKIQGGRQPNIVPESCYSELDFRLVHEEHRDLVQKMMEDLGRSALPGATFFWETISYKRPLSSPRENPWLSSFIGVYEEVLGERYQPKIASFCTDLPTMFPEAAPPFAIFGPGNILQAHQPDEFVEISSIERAGRVLEAFLERVLFP